MPMLVWADVDVGIAWLVNRLNAMPGVRTEASCEWTLFGDRGERRPQVMAIWPPEMQPRLEAEYDVEILGECWGYVRPRRCLPKPS